MQRNLILSSVAAAIIGGAIGVGASWWFYGQALAAIAAEMVERPKVVVVDITKIAAIAYKLPEEERNKALNTVNVKKAELAAAGYLVLDNASAMSYPQNLAAETSAMMGGSYPVPAETPAPHPEEQK
jgi:hypothetical protein